jgi:hypothetical protein
MYRYAEKARRSYRAKRLSPISVLLRNKYATPVPTVAPLGPTYFATSWATIGSFGASAVALVAHF